MSLILSDTIIDVDGIYHSPCAPSPNMSASKCSFHGRFYFIAIALIVRRWIIFARHLCAQHALAIIMRFIEINFILVV